MACDTGPTLIFIYLLKGIENGAEFGAKRGMRLQDDPVKKHWSQSCFSFPTQSSRYERSTDTKTKLIE